MTYEPPKWQDISTAPRDGTEVDLWLVDQDGRGWRVTDAYWTESAGELTTEHNPDGTYRTVHINRSGWFAPYHDYEMRGFCDTPKYYNAHPRQQKWVFTEATHWMPLPEPPTPQGKNT